MTHNTTNTKSSLTYVKIGVVCRGKSRDGSYTLADFNIHIGPILDRYNAKLLDEVPIIAARDYLVTGSKRHVKAFLDEFRAGMRRLHKDAEYYIHLPPKTQR